LIGETPHLPGTRNLRFRALGATAPATGSRHLGGNTVRFRRALATCLAVCLAVSIPLPSLAHAYPAVAVVPAPAVQATPYGEMTGKGWLTPGQAITHSEGDPGPVPESILHREPVEPQAAAMSEEPSLPPSPELSVHGQPVVCEPASVLSDLVPPAEGGVKPEPLYELPALRTWNTRHFLNTDGSITAEIWPGPVNYLDQAGKWRPIDLTPRLASRPGSRGEGDQTVYRVDQASFILELPDVAGGPVTIEGAGGARLELAPLGVTATVARLEDGRIVYPEAWPGADIVEEPMPEGVKETVLLKNPNTLPALCFSVSLGGLLLRGDGDGGLEVYDPTSGQVHFVLPRPYLEDASGEIGAAEYVVRAPVTAGALSSGQATEGGSVTPPAGSRAVLEIVPDLSWLADPARVYPVRVDPTVTVSASSKDSYGDAAYPNTNSGTIDHFHFGTQTAYLGWVAWDISSISPNVAVTSAAADLYTYSPSTGSTSNYAMEALAGEWGESTVTWNNQPAGAGYYSLSRFSPPTASTWETWDITGIFALWQKGLLPNNGVKLYCQTASPMLTAKSREATSGYRPHLHVTYTSGANGLGVEPYWNLMPRDLGDGWQASVNTMSRNLVLRKSLFQIAGRGPGLSENLTYNLAATTAGHGAGYGWRPATDMIVTEAADDSYVDLTDEDGTTLRYLSDGAGGYTLPPGVFRKLKKESETVFTLTAEDQTVLRFENGPLVSLADPNGNATTLTRDEGGRVTSQTDATGRQLLYTYSPSGLLDTLTDPAGRVYVFAYDPGGAGLLTSITGPSGEVVGFGYDATRLASFVDARGQTTTFLLGPGLEITGIRDARSTPGANFDTLFAWSVAGNKCLTRVTDPAGRWADYEHNPATWNRVSSSNQLGQTTTYTWTGNLLTRESHPVSDTFYTYDTGGNVTQVKRELAGDYILHNYSYDTKNNPLSLTNGNGQVTNGRYDAACNLLSALDPTNKEADGVRYDENGNPVELTPAGAATASPVLNGSFERAGTGDLPEAWSYWGSAGTTVARDGAYALYGQYSARVSATSPSDAGLCQVAFTDSPTVIERLTLSANLRLTDVVSTSGGGAAIGVEYLDPSTDLVLKREYGNFYAGTGTVRPALALKDLPLAGCKYRVVLRLYQATGTVWFDGVQLEIAYAPGAYTPLHTLSPFNSLENTGFDAGGAITPWSDGSPDFTIGWVRYSLKLYLLNTGTRTSRQTVAVNNSERFTLAGMVRLSSVTGTGGVKLCLDFYDSAGLWLSGESTRTLSGTIEWTRLALAADPPAEAVTARVTLALAEAKGTAWFDNIQLIPTTTTRLGWEAPGNYRTASTDPLGNTLHFAFDSVGNRTLLSDALGQTTSFTRDAAGRVTTVTDASGRASYWAYDGSGNLVAWSDPRSSDESDPTYLTTLSYTPLGQVVGVTDPLSRSAAYAYDAAGNLLTATFPGGRQALFAYDGANRLAQEQRPADGRTITYTRNGDGVITGVADSTGANFTYTVDQIGRPTSVVGPGGTLALAWDKESHVTSTTYDTRQYVYQYDAAGRLAAMDASSSGPVFLYYDDQGRLFEALGGTFSAIYMKRLIERYGTGWIRTINDKGNPGGRDISYEYDANGNVLTYEQGAAEESFGYDARNQLVTWIDANGVPHSYTYDPAGNLTGKDGVSFTHDAANQITNAGFTHDPSGNLTSDGVMNYVYDTLNQLTQVTRVSDGSVVAAYAYDYRGLRISKTTSAGTTTYLWRPDGLLYRESGPWGYAVYYWAGEGQLVQMDWCYSGTTKRLVAHTNARGDVVSLTDKTSGYPIVATYRYGPWGELLSAEGTCAGQPIRCAGYYHDAETGLYYLKGRYYSPALGRFLTRDPARESPSYDYAGGNPLSFVDPSGLVEQPAEDDASGTVVMIVVDVEQYTLKDLQYLFGYVAGAGAVVALLVSGPFGAVVGAIVLGAAVGGEATVVLRYYHYRVDPRTEAFAMYSPMNGEDAFYEAFDFGVTIVCGVIGIRGGFRSPKP